MMAMTWVNVIEFKPAMATRCGPLMVFEVIIPEHMLASLAGFVAIAHGVAIQMGSNLFHTATQVMLALYTLYGNHSIRWSR